MEITQEYPTAHTYEIRVSDTRHKFADALTEYVHDVCMDSWESDSRGDAESTIGWFAPVGSKRILRGDSRGFVWIEKFDDSAGRDAVLAALDLFEMVWIDPAGDAEMFGEEHDAEIATALAYVAYVYSVVADACLPHDFEMWEVHGRPTGPLG